MHKLYTQLRLPSDYYLVSDKTMVCSTFLQYPAGLDLHTIYLTFYFNSGLFHAKLAELNNGGKIMVEFMKKC